MLKTQKTLKKNLRFFNDFGRFRSSICRHLEAMLGYVGPSWRYVEPSGVILALSCDILNLSSDILGTRCDPRAPTLAKIFEKIKK